MKASKGPRNGCACLGIALAVVAVLVGVVYLTCSNFIAGLMGEESYAISGDNRRFDPFAKLPEIKSRIQATARLVSIQATFVRSDGTMDLKADYTPFPQTEYIFVRPLDKAPENAPPVGAGRGPDDIWYEEIRVKCYQPGQRRHVRRMGGDVNAEYSYVNLGMEVERGSPRSGQPDPAIPDPKCSTQELWKIALAKGADPNSVARISYDKSGYGFRIDRTDLSFKCDEACRERE